MIADYQRHYVDTWRDKTRLYDGISKVIGALRADGMKTAVLSNKPDHFTKLCCDHFFAPAVLMPFAAHAKEFRASRIRRPDSNWRRNLA